jgi:PAS domain S-box-containing protein
VHHEPRVASSTSTRPVATSAEMSQRLLDAAPDATVVVGSDGTIRLANRQVEALFGHGREELVGQPVEVLLPDRSRKGHLGLRAAYIAQPAVRAMGEGQVLYARRKDGTEFPAEISLSPLESGEGILVIAAIRDASERQALAAQQKRLLRQAEAAEAQFRSLLEAAPDAMVVAGRHGRILLVNRQAEALFGCTREDLVGQPIETLLPERFRAGHAGLRETYTANPRPRPMGAGLELFARRRDGSELPVEICLSPVETAEGVLVSAAIRDVSDRHRADAELRRQAALLELAPTAVLVRDRHDAILYWNKAAQDMYGWTAAEARGRVTHALLSTRFPIPLVEIEAILAQEGRWDGELVHTTRDGQQIVVSSRQALQRDAAGQPVGTLEINTDITAAKTAEAALHATAEELARSNRELEQFAYVASHDLQEPLRMVASYTRLLQRRYVGRLDTDADEFIEFAVDGATRMQRLINDLLAYSRVGTQGQALEPTDVEAILARVVVDLGPSIAQHQASITHTPLPTVLADAVQLYSVFLNLIGNALKYRAEAPPRVQIRAERKGDLWQFAVSDNGIGIEPQYAERIFVLFQRLHTREHSAGTGIGLAVCKKIVERHGGRIWIDSSAAGQGTTFFFTLPAVT